MKIRHINNVQEAIDFESMFGPDDDFKRNSIVARGEPIVEPYVLTLYRGFTVDVANLEKSGTDYILSPDRSEQGLIWFTHNLIRGYDPVEYVKGRGTHILTYPLKCKRHIQELEWSDGSTSTTTPPEFDELVNSFENCRYHMGIELPEGWVFSYKTEKFVGCSTRLKISPNMLQNDPSF
jgi:hypothetical protein